MEVDHHTEAHRAAHHTEAHPAEAHTAAAHQVVHRADTKKFLQGLYQLNQY